ncbi:MAG: eukaryotic-like serine/threonine-protein kinase [Mycobacterium sp.]|nr:eukaryotic-like serine/threonine-protein kinase [Mycobacterium sp.]
MELGKHDNVVQVYSAEIEGATPVIRMEYLEEGSVAGKFGRDALPVREALQIMEAACRGVMHIHHVGLLHRDIKPANPLLHPLQPVKVSDFGLACHPVDVGSGTAMPYLAHLPPEAFADGTMAIIDVTGDVYALALTTYRLLNGDRVVRPKLDARFPVPIEKDWKPYIHKSLRTAVTKALNPNPDKRTQSAQDFRYALEKGRPVVTWQEGPPNSLASDELRVWHGSALGGTDWRARIVRTSSTNIRLRVERRLRNKDWRARNSDNIDATALDEFAESLFIRTASFRLPSRGRENTLGMTLSSTATTTMTSTKPGVTELSPATSIIVLRSR